MEMIMSMKMKPSLSYFQTTLRSLYQILRSCPHWLVRVCAHAPCMPCMPKAWSAVSVSVLACQTSHHYILFCRQMALYFIYSLFILLTVCSDVMCCCPNMSFSFPLSPMMDYFGIHENELNSSLFLIRSEFYVV